MRRSSRAKRFSLRTCIDFLEHRLALTGTVLPDVHVPAVDGAEILYVRTTFLDETSDPQTTSSAITTLDKVVDFYERNSYGETLTYTVPTSPIALPHNRSYYGSNWTLLINDARAAAVAINPSYATTTYTVVRTASSATWNPGLGGVTPGGIPLPLDIGNVLFSSSPETAIHELGHNFGLTHASANNPAGATAAEDRFQLSNPTAYGYSDSFDIMGSGPIGSGSEGDLNIIHKYRTGWLTAAELPSITSDGDVEISPHDSVTSLTSGKDYGAIVARDDRVSYWVEYRQGLSSSLYNDYGVQLRWSIYSGLPVVGSGGGVDTVLLHMNAPSSSYANASLLVGRTFSDPGAGVHITNVGATPGATGHADIHVSFGQSPHAPDVKLESETLSVATSTDVELSVAASDTDGDDLAYAWEVETDVGGTLTWVPLVNNSPNLTYSWATAGYYRVSVAVSDMGGNVVRRNLAVKVGSTSSLVGIKKGQVTDASGNPVEGAVVTYTPNGGSVTATSISDSAGVYLLPVIASGSSGFVDAVVDGGFIVSSRENRLFSHTDIAKPFDFVAVDKAYAINGSVSGAIRAGAVVTLKDAGGNTVATATTGNNGAYGFVVADLGQYEISAVHGSETLRFSGATEAILHLDGAAVTSAPTAIHESFDISGDVSGGGYVRVRATNGSYADVTPSDPTFYLVGQSGNFYLRAAYLTSGTVSLSPTFSGLATVTSSGVTGLDFSPYGSGPSRYYISGYARGALAPVVGAQVTLKLNGSVVAGPIPTDDVGGFVFYGLEAGGSFTNAYSIEIAKTGVTFSSSTYNVSGFTNNVDSTLVNTTASGIVFTATGLDSAPTISSVTRTVADGNPRLSLFEASTSDDGPTGALRYSWSATGPGTVTFFTNDTAGTNSAETFAAFQLAGTYQVTTTVKDGAGNTTTSTQTVVVGSYADTVAPLVHSYAFAFQHVGQYIDVQFSEDVTGVGAGDFVLTNTTTSTVYSSLTLVSYDATSFTTRFSAGNSPSIFPNGRYELTFAGTVTIDDSSSNDLVTDDGFEFFILQGDFDHDGTIDFDDLLIYQQNYYTMTGMYWATGDIDYDGDVDFDEMLWMNQHYGDYV